MEVVKRGGEDYQVVDHVRNFFQKPFGERWYNVWSATLRVAIVRDVLRAAAGVGEDEQGDDRVTKEETEAPVVRP